MIRHRSEWSEITVDDLLDHIKSNNLPLRIDIRSAPEFNRADGPIPNTKHVPIRKSSLVVKLLSE